MPDLLPLLNAGGDHHPLVQGEEGAQALPQVRGAGQPLEKGSEVELEEKLNAGDRQGALKLLQGSILPFLSAYTSKTNDMGLSRTLISPLRTASELLLL